jgi:hypothetical protein
MDGFVGGRLEGWIFGWKDRWMGEWMDGRVCRCIDGEGRVDVSMRGWMDGGMGRRVVGCLNGRENGLMV